MNLVRDCLDKQLRDREGRKMGRVDGLVMELDGEAQPRVTFIEVGAVAQAARLHPRLGRWVAALARRWGRAERGMRPQRGHLMPTGPCTMQSGQIGSPHSAHETHVSTRGWLTQRGACSSLTVMPAAPGD